MTPEQILALGPAFAAYLRGFDDCFAQQRTRDHLHTYCRGLLSDLPRKSVEPIALTAGVAVRTLQEFLRDHSWDHHRFRDRLQRLVARATPDPDDDLGTGGIIDETSGVKKGDRTPGVQRQWCGEVGKTENCIVTVHLGISRGDFKTLVDADLYLPRSWDADRERCRAAGIPDDVVYRPKWRIALEQLDRARANGVQLDWLTFDENYGGKPAFLEELDRRDGLFFVGEVPKSFRCLTQRPRGRPPAGGWKGKRADHLALFSSRLNRQDWQPVQLARLTLAEQEWEVRATLVWLLRRGQPTDRTYWLIVARNTATGEVKYFVSNAPADAPLERLLRIAFRRWNVEHAFRVSKTEVGFGHFEGRSYVGLLRHLWLCLATLTFVAGQADRLRGEKCGGDAGAGVPGAEPAVRGVAVEAAGDDGVATHVGSHRLSPAAEPGGPGITTKTIPIALIAL
jgi:SRSO17 transposase